jgi:hypothetical protein
MLGDFDPERNETGSRDDRARVTGTPDDAADAADAPLHLCFNWRSYRIDAVLTRGKDHDCDLIVTSDLGFVPYTAQGRHQRINIFAILRATQGGFPIQIDITENQRLKLTARAALPNPVTAAVAIAGVAALLVQARPYLDMIDMMQPNSESVRVWQ